MAYIRKAAHDKLLKIKEEDRKARSKRNKPECMRNFISTIFNDNRQSLAYVEVTPIKNLRNTLAYAANLQHSYFS